MHPKDELTCEHTSLFAPILPQVCNGKRSEETKLPEPKDRAAIRVHGLHAPEVTIRYMPTCTPSHKFQSYLQTNNRMRYPEREKRSSVDTDGSGAKRRRRQTFTT